MMNEYEVTFSMFNIIRKDEIDYIDTKNHFSNCRKFISGNTAKEAWNTFKKEQYKIGWHVIKIQEIMG